MTTSPRTAPAPLSLTARTPEDLLAVVPIALGFEPEESLVMITLGGDPSFHARVDLPATAADLDAVVASLVAPARRHRVPRAVLVAYSHRGRAADRALLATRRALERSGTEVVDGVRSDGRRWYAVPRRSGVPEHGVPYDLSGHRFAAEAVVDGRVLHRSRAALAASVAADPAAVARVVTALAEPAEERPAALVEGSWARELVVRHTSEGTRPDDPEVARLLRGMLDVRVRDAAWSPLCRAVARDHVDLWSDVVRRTPGPLLPAPATLLAFSAWQAGDGALAWCALDRCEEADPAYSLAGLVAHLLSEAVPPSTWEGGFDWTEGLEPSPLRLPDQPDLA